MSAGRMHADEYGTDEALVRRLVAGQFPQWAGLDVRPLGPVGTSNAMYRLGEEMVVRLPRIAGAAADVQKEHAWLPRLAGALPVPVPLPLGQGLPGEGYPWAWSVYGWLAGETPTAGRLDRPAAVAGGLAAFTTALQAVDPAGGPASYRSETLADRDWHVRRAIAELAELGEVDGCRVTEHWEAALRVPEHDGPPVWIHADLQPGNLLIADGRLGGVIDFGCAGLGDPAVDLLPAWYVLPRSARAEFRRAAGADAPRWERGRGWALSVALMELRYYRLTNARMAGTARHVIGEVIEP